MDYFLILIYSIITIIVFLKKKEYVIATFLVGQPILKLMTKPFPTITNQKMFLIYYIVIGLAILTGIAIKKNIILTIQKSSIIMILTNLSFGILMALYLIISPMIEYGFTKIIDYFTMIFPIIFLTVVLLKNTDDLVKLLASISNLALFIGIITISLIYIKTGSFLARLGTTIAKEIEVFDVNFAVSIWYGRRMGLGFFSSFFLTRLYPSRFNKVKTILLFILVILSVSRGPLLATLFSLFIIIIMDRKNKKNYDIVLKYALSFLIITAVVVIMYMIYLDQGLFNRLISLDDKNVQSRFYLYKISLKMFLNNPIGMGLGGFASYGGIHNYPHNIFLEILVELGIVGCVFFMTLILKSFSKYFNVVNRVVGIKYLIIMQYSLIVLIFALVNAQFSGDIGSNEYIWLGIALIAFTQQLARTETKASPQVRSG